MTYYQGDSGRRRRISRRRQYGSGYPGDIADSIDPRESMSNVGSSRGQSSVVSGYAPSLTESDRTARTRNFYARRDESPNNYSEYSGFTGGSIGNVAAPADDWREDRGRGRRQQEMALVPRGSRSRSNSGYELVTNDRFPRHPTTMLPANSARSVASSTRGGSASVSAAAELEFLAQGGSAEQAYDKGFAVGWRAGLDRPPYRHGTAEYQSFKSGAVAGVLARGRGVLAGERRRDAQNW